MYEVLIFIVLFSFIRSFEFVLNTSAEYECGMWNHLPFAQTLSLSVKCAVDGNRLSNMNGSELIITLIRGKHERIWRTKCTFRAQIVYEKDNLWTWTTTRYCDKLVLVAGTNARTLIIDWTFVPCLVPRYKGKFNSFQSLLTEHWKVMVNRRR